MYSESTTPDGRGPWARVLSAPQVPPLSHRLDRRPPALRHGRHLAGHLRPRPHRLVRDRRAGRPASTRSASPSPGRFSAASVDRRGPRPVLAPASVVCALALVAIVVIGEGSAGTVPLALACARRGRRGPPGQRRRAAHLAGADPAPGPHPRLPLRLGPDRDRLRLRAASHRPARAPRSSPAAPLFVGAGFVLVGTAWFLLVPVVRGERPARPSTAPGRRPRLAGDPLRHPHRHPDRRQLRCPRRRPAGLRRRPRLDLRSAALFAASISVGSMLGAFAFGVFGARLGNLRQVVPPAGRPSSRW